MDETNKKRPGTYENNVTQKMRMLKMMILIQRKQMKLLLMRESFLSKGF